jgi:hypothetical protein
MIYYYIKPFSVPPKKPLVHDSNGRKMVEKLGPFKVGDDLSATCVTVGGQLCRHVARHGEISPFGHFSVKVPQTLKYSRNNVCYFAVSFLHKTFREKNNLGENMHYTDLSRYNPHLKNGQIWVNLYGHSAGQSYRMV